MWTTCALCHMTPVRNLELTHQTHFSHLAAICKGGSENKTTTRGVEELSLCYRMKQFDFIPPVNMLIISSRIKLPVFCMIFIVLPSLTRPNR